LGAAFIATTSFVMINDAEIASFFQRNKSPITKDLAFGFEKMGNGTYCFPTMGALYLSGLIFKNERLQYTGLQAFKALVIGGGIAELIKIVVERERPFQTNNPYVFHGLVKPSLYNSFPSGHTFDAFAIATVISQNVKNKWWNIPIYAAATGVALSRVHDNKHWASDVMMGAAIGYCVGKVVMKSGNYPFERVKKLSAVKQF
jgi:membrane-associated phospholipid phosphatase